MSVDFVVEILMFLFAGNFFANAAIWGIAVFFIGLYLNGWKIEKSISLVFVVFAGISYFFIYSVNYGFPPARVLFSRMIGPIILFISGGIIIGNAEEKIDRYGLIVAFGMAFHGALNILINWNSNIVNTVGRSMKDIWGGVIAATGQNLLMAMITSLLFYFVFCCNKRLIKIIGITMVALSIIGTLTNGSRTLLYIIAISFACMIVYYCSQTKNLTKKVKIIMTTLFVFWVGIFAVTINFMGVSDWINNSGLFVRYAGNMSHMMTQTGRSSLSEYVLAHLWDYPFGNMPVSNYAHNLWLDIDIEVGWIPMTMHVLFCVAAMINIVKFGIEKNESSDRQVLLLSILLAMMMEFFIEPVLMGNPYFYMCFCFLVGGITTHNRKSI